MLRSLQIENFKCFGSPAQTVRLAPLTLLFGQNNAGKSTILQSLLLLRQSLDSAAYRPQLSLNGACFGGGSFRDVVHRHDMRREVRLVLQFDLEDKARSRVDLAFDAHEPDPPRLSSMELTTAGFDRMAVKRGRGHGGPYELWIGDKKQGGERAANFSFLAGGFLPIFGDEPPMRGRPSERRRDARSAGRDAIQTLAGLLLGMRAVGPFRRSPERRYEHTGPPADRLDVTGAHAVEALVHDALSRRQRGGPPLLADVARWLRRLARVSVTVSPVDRRGRLCELLVHDERRARANFADVGFGIGQALPVLVEGLRTPAGGLFLVQEPEIHLHPDAQLAMADFLVDLARSGRQVIAETHSEHLLLRVRRLVAARTRHKGIAADDLSVVHVGKSARSGTARIQRLELDDLGQIKAWPRGFFEEANDERLALLEETARRVEGQRP